MSMRSSAVAMPGTHAIAANHHARRTANFPFCMSAPAYGDDDAGRISKKHAVSAAPWRRLFCGAWAQRRGDPMFADGGHGLSADGRAGHPRSRLGKAIDRVVEEISQPRGGEQDGDHPGVTLSTPIH